MPLSDDGLLRRFIPHLRKGSADNLKRNMRINSEGTASLVSDYVNALRNFGALSLLQEIYLSKILGSVYEELYGNKVRAKLDTWNAKTCRNAARLLSSAQQTWCLAISNDLRDLKMKYFWSSDFRERNGSK